MNISGFICNYFTSVAMENYLQFSSFEELSGEIFEKCFVSLKQDFFIGESVS